jgi:hypothetical protein
LEEAVQTWARQCDGLFAASNFSEHSLGSIDLRYLISGLKSIRTYFKRSGVCGTYRLTIVRDASFVVFEKIQQCRPCFVLDWYYR